MEDIISKVEPLKYDYLWQWTDNKGLLHMTPDEKEAEVAMLLGYPVYGEKIGPED